MELKGKIVNFLGDSITEGVGVSDIENCRYDNVLKREAGLAATYNYGVGGTRLAHQIHPSGKPRHDLCFCGRAYDLNRAADLIVVYGGINDYLHGDAPFGEAGDTTPATFIGAVHCLMNFLTTEYADKTVVFMLPARSYWKNMHDIYPSTLEMKRPDAKPLIDYVNVIKETAKSFGIPTLDLYHELGIDPNNEADYEEYTVDGLHFNDKGHAVIAAKLREFLEGI